MKLTFRTGVSTYLHPDPIRGAATDIKAIALAVLIVAAKNLERLAISPVATATFLAEGTI